jgi:hypothetical protein
MPTVPINNVGQYGIIQDAPAHTLPPNAWSGGQNVRARLNFVEKFLGHTVQFDTPTVDPYNLLFVSSPAQIFWLLPGLAKVYVYNGATHTDVTRSSGGDYTTTADENWIMTNFQGIPVMTNGFDEPQMWSPPNIATELTELTNWPAADRCNAIRAYKQFLVAMDLTKSGVRQPLTVKWSHPAPANTVPSSWDETDPTKDVGEVELADTTGVVLDGQPMRDIFVIYKEDSVWGMQFVGGPSVMRFFRIFDGFGALSKRCAAEYFFGRHLVLGVDDIYTHDGQNKQSVVDGKVRRWLYAQINPARFRRSFVQVFTATTEVWCCVPTGSSDFPNLAAVWNWTNNTVTFRDLPNVAGSGDGVLFTGGPDLWDTDSETWESDPSAWDKRIYNPADRKVLFARPDPKKVFLADNSNLFDGSTMTSYVERVGLGVPFRASQPPDISSMKFMTAVWPRLKGANGGVVKVYVGSQVDADGPVTYQAPVNYTIGTSRQIPCRVSGRLFALKFESTTNIDWQLAGYDMDVKQVGRF